MNLEQKHISAAFVLVGVGLTVKHGWLGKTLNWTKAPPGPGKAGGVQTPNVGPWQLNDWEAALIAYAILMLGGGSDLFAPTCVALAWAVGLVELFAAIPTLSKNFPATFTSASPTQAAANVLSNASQPAQPAPQQGVVST